MRCPSYLDSYPDLTEKTRVSNGHPCRNSRIYPRFLPQLEKTNETSPHLEIKPDSAALHAELLHFPNKTCKEPRFVLLNSRESPTTLSQDEKNTDVNLRMQNCSVYPKPNCDETNFPCIGSVTIPRSTSYRTSGLTPFRKLERFPETTVSSIEYHQFQ